MFPQYPLYSASIALYGGSAAGYYLDESTNWGLDVRAVTACCRVSCLRFSVGLTFPRRAGSGTCCACRVWRQVKDLHRAIKDARAAGQNVRAMAVINPGNPTGGVLTKDNMRDVIDFCVDNNVVLMADEVYQVRLHTVGRYGTSDTSAVE